MVKIKTGDFVIPAVVLVLFTVVIGFLLFGGGLIGLSTADINTLITLMPGVICIFLALFVAAQTKGFMVAGAVAGIGLAVSFLIHLMNTEGILIPGLGISAPHIEIVIIIIFMILAVALAVTRK